jgi:hypothetical protein
MPLGSGTAGKMAKKPFVFTFLSRFSSNYHLPPAHFKKPKNNKEKIPINFRKRKISFEIYE